MTVMNRADLPCRLNGGGTAHQSRAADAFGSHARRAQGVVDQSVWTDHDSSAKDDRTLTASHPSTVAAAQSDLADHLSSGADPTHGAGRSIGAGAALDNAAAGFADIACVENKGCADRIGTNGFRHGSCPHPAGRTRRHLWNPPMPGNRARVRAAEPQFDFSLSTSTSRSAL